MFVILCNIIHNHKAYYVVLFNNKQGMNYRYCPLADAGGRFFMVT